MFQRYLSVLTVLFALSIGSFSTLTPAIAQTKGEVPGAALGIKSDSDLWRYVRTGNAGTSQMKNELAGVMIQSEGDNWRAFRNGPLSVYGAYGLAGIIGLLIVFYLVRGRIRIDAGPSTDKIQRFGPIDRFAHWLMAGSFVVLAITGLNLLYGRHVLIPIFGKEAFSTITTIGKFAHNYLAFAFMAGLALSFLLWARHNIPNKLDLKWLAMGGGIFVKGVHPPARKFNAGQKVIFWAVMIGGLSVSMSGIALMFPFQTSMFADTFAMLNMIGFSLPTDFTAMQEQQLNQLWHGIVSMGLMTMIIAHIYIGSVGMEGALDAMNSGMVDRNWAKEHHNLWVEEEDQKADPKPAE